MTSIWIDIQLTVQTVNLKGRNLIRNSIEILEKDKFIKNKIQHKKNENHRDQQNDWEKHHLPL